MFSPFRKYIVPLGFLGHFEKQRDISSTFITFAASMLRKIIRILYYGGMRNFFIVLHTIVTAPETEKIREIQRALKNTEYMHKKR